MAAEVLQRFIFFGASVTIWDIVASCWGVSTIYPFARQLFCKQACWQGLPGVYIGGFLLTRQNTYCGVFLLARTDIGQWALPNGQQRRVLCVLWGAKYFAPSNSWYVWKLWRMKKRIKLWFHYQLCTLWTGVCPKKAGPSENPRLWFPYLQHILRPSSLQCSDGISLLAAPLPSLWPIQAGWA